jgi:diguanylate cyclase (GGDEF)-like protein
VIRGAGAPLSVLCFGITKMDRINQAYGYAVGDRVLAQIGALLGRAGRAEDLSARFGDDRFCLVVNSIAAREARGIGDRIAAIVTETALAIGGGQSIGVELRTGVAEWSHGDHAGSLIFRAFDRMQPFGLRKAS